MIHVRELPPLRLHYEIETPTGRRYRWGGDEPNAANVPSGGSDSSTMPGGYEQADVSLPRKPGTDYADLVRLSTLRARGAGGAIAWEGRLERAPRVSGDQMAISPSAVGWQAHLDDDKSAREIYIDRDLSHWTGAPVKNRIGLAGGGYTAIDPVVQPDPSTGAPALALEIHDSWTSTTKPHGYASYYQDGLPIGAIYAEWAKNANVGAADTNWSWDILVATDTDVLSYDQTANLRATGPGSAIITATTRRTAGRLALVYFNVTGWTVAGAMGATYGIYWTKVAVFGDHGLTGRGAGGVGGFFASDIVTHAVGRWAPLLTIDGTVQASDFVIPHLTFLDPTTAGEIVRQATAFGLQDWAVWDNRKFYWAERGTYGRKWRARIGPAQLSETGPQVDRLWESIMVQYTDVDGSTRTAGPPGSGADTEDPLLKDTDPENPANQLGIVRRDLLVVGTGTAAGAIQKGYRFLQEQKLLDSSGQARLVGHVMDDRGVMHPYWRVRAGDQISFVDAADTSYRRIVRAANDHGARTCTIDLDAPPEGLDAILARIGAELVPLGLS